MSDEAQITDAEQRSDGQTPQPVSERKLNANRENAKKSTGPKTADGKRRSSFNAMKHGLLVQRIGRSELNELVNGLYDRYGRDGDVRTELLVELAALDYWRHAHGLDVELDQLRRTREYHVDVSRYITANRRALMKTIEMLEQVRLEKLKDEATDVESAGDDSSVPPEQGPVQ